MINWLIAFLLTISSAAHAEIFYGIEYADTLGDVKKKYPGAVFKNISPAWLQPEEKFMNMTGVGINNKISIIFSDSRPFFLSVSKNQSSELFRNISNTIANQSNDDALTVAEVRVTYKSPIKIGLFKKRYGASTCYENEEFVKICKFPDSALTAILTDDGNFVRIAISRFTDGEKKQSLRRKAIEDWEKNKREAHPLDAPVAAPAFIE